MTIDADRTALARRVYQAAHLTGTFRLRSGLVSDEYSDKYLFELDPRACGRSGTPLHPKSRIAQRRLPAWSSAAFRWRKEAKTYGTCRLAERGEVAGRRLAVIEDVVTSGGQLLQSCTDLRERGAEIEAVLCVIDRQQGGREALEAAALTFRPVFTMDDLITAVAQSQTH